MARDCRSTLKKNFILDDDYYFRVLPFLLFNFKNRKTYYDWPREATDMESVQHVRNLPYLEEIINKKDYLFKDLIRRCLTIDPDKRISCKEALRHRFFD
jgi:dual-specificity kinase